MRADHSPTALLNRSALLSGKVMVAGLLALGLAAVSLSYAQTQQPEDSTTKPPAASSTAKTPTSSRPVWTELTPSQQQSLAPLAVHWNGLHPAQKRKWIALARNFDSMSPADQETLHSRMTEWAALSAQERTRARLNFAEVKRLAPEDERKAKWEAYQALSDEEKRKLAERAGSRPPSAAAPVRPVPAQKLAPVPTSNTQYPPRIQLAPAAAPSSPSAPAATSTPSMAPAAPAATSAAPPAPASSAAPSTSVTATPSPSATSPVAPSPPTAPAIPLTPPRPQEAP